MHSLYRKFIILILPHFDVIANSAESSPTPSTCTYYQGITYMEKSKVYSKIKLTPLYAMYLKNKVKNRERQNNIKPTRAQPHLLGVRSTGNIINQAPVKLKMNSFSPFPSSQRRADLRKRNTLWPRI